MAWTNPKTWSAVEVVTAANMNLHLRDNLLYLYRRPRSVVTVVDQANVSTISTTFTAINDAVWTVEVETTGGDVLLWFNGSILNTGNGSAVMLDILHNSNYLSSGSPTPLTNGLRYHAGVGTGYQGQFQLNHLVTGLAAGVQTFRLRWRVTGAAGVLYLDDQVTQFGAMEV